MTKADGSKAGRGTRERLLDRHWMLMGSLVILAGLLLGVLMFVWFEPVAAVCVGGLIVLFFTALGLNMLSNEEDMSSGEVQKAIAFTVLYVYFGLMGFGRGAVPENSIVAAAIEHFWVVVASVIGFYFGGRVIEQLRTPSKGPVESLVGDTVWELRKQIRAKGSIQGLQDEIDAVHQKLEPLVRLEALGRRR